jgi:signal transduction histidine kinase
VPDLALAIVPRGPDPAAASRARLLTTAVAGVLVLTFVVAGLAGRDVLRELRTASMRSAFVASVTHDLKTPLTAIRLLTETLRRGRARPEAREELFDMITAEAERLGRLVDNVLSSSRIEGGTQQYRPRAVSLTGAVWHALRRVEAVLRNEGFELVERLDDDRLVVDADPDALDQAVLNLVANAMKYSGESRSIEVSTDRRGGHAIVSVADRGIGIAPADQARVFDRFYRTKAAAAHTTGAGLGLALVRHFVEAHGGRASLESEVGRGSTFSLWLPIAMTPGGHPDA